jgi:hypothetical protein
MFHRCLWVKSFLLFWFWEPALQIPVRPPLQQLFAGQRISHRIHIKPAADLG